jgi:pimeloyl-ACP methyl ester carboxylesterase
MLTEEGTSKTVYAGGMNIHYHDVGTGDPIILLHSTGLGVTAWITFYKILPELAQHYRCIAMDMPNFAKTGPYVYNEPVHSLQARTALALMDALGIQKAHLVGNSQGGQSAMVFAYKYPDRINKLVWGAGHVSNQAAYKGEYMFTVRPEASGIYSPEASQNPTRENFRRYLSLVIRDEALITDELVDYLIKYFTGRPDRAEARAKSKAVAFEHQNYIATIKAPTLIIWGRYDRTCNFEVGINALNHIANSRLVLLHCGHWVPFEKPDEYTAHLLNFLKSDWT